MYLSHVIVCWSRRYCLASFLCLLAFSLLHIEIAKGQVLQFNNISIKDGLSQGTVSCILQDNEGFIWLGTRDGLNRYDGVSFVNLKNNPLDSNSISSNSIIALHQDLSGNIWVGTSMGLNRLNPKTLDAKNYFHWFEDEHSLSSNKITAIITDAKGRLWVGTENGLNALVPESGTFERFSIQADDSSSLSNNHITALLALPNGRICVGTMGGMNIFDPERNTFKRYVHGFTSDKGISNNEVTCIAPSSDDRIWVGTRQGLNQFDPENNSFAHYFKDQPIKDFLPSSVIRALTYDNEGNLYIGTSLGLAAINSEKLEPTPAFNKSVISNMHVRSLLVDNSGLVWVGSQSVGVSTINFNALQFLSVYYSSDVDDNIDRNQIYTFAQLDSNCVFVGTASGLNTFDPVSRTASSAFDVQGHPLREFNREVRALNVGNNKLWIGTKNEGLVAYDIARRTVKTYNIDPQNPHSISSNKITSLLNHQGGNVWIGTLGGGLCYFDAKTERFSNYRFDITEGGLRENNITCLEYDTEGTLWVGTGQSGLYRLLDIATGTFERFPVGSEEKGMLDSPVINDLHLDESGRMWIATSGGGIALWRPEVELFQTFNEADGLANNVVLSITSDLAGNLWISTNSGLSSFSIATQTFRNYFEDEVLSQNTFNAGSSYRDQENRIYFGGSNGFDYLHSGRIGENSFIPNIVITGCMLLNENVNRKKNAGSSFAIDTLILKHDHPGFTIEFAALNYRQPEKNQYAYRLLGLFDNWRYIKNRHFATFSNLLPGTYTFEVIGSNNDGLWNYRPAIVVVIVKPSFWQMWESKLLLAVLVVLCFYGIYRAKLRGERRRRLALQRAVADRTREIARERDINETLLREVHHRVKNNLQIIVSLLNLQSRFIKDRSLLEVFNEIQNRVRSMSLIHQKMYQSKDLSTLNITGYIDDLSNNLISAYSLTGRIKLDVKVKVDRLTSDTLTPLGLIINEVISNSLKYAFSEDQEGLIIVRLERLESGKLEMLIGDNGSGLPDDFDFTSEDSFGMELILALTEQLSGTIIHRSDLPGAIYQIDFEEIDA